MDLEIQTARRRCLADPNSPHAPIESLRWAWRTGRVKQTHLRFAAALGHPEIRKLWPNERAPARILDANTLTIHFREWKHMMRHVDHVMLVRVHFYLVRAALTDHQMTIPDHALSPTFQCIAAWLESASLKTLKQRMEDGQALYRQYSQANILSSFERHWAAREMLDEIFRAMFEKHPATHLQNFIRRVGPYYFVFSFECSPRSALLESLHDQLTDYFAALSQ